MYQHPQSHMSHFQVCTSTHHHVCHTSRSVPAPTVMYVTLQVCTSTYSHICHTSRSVPAPSHVCHTFRSVPAPTVIYVTLTAVYQHPQSHMSHFQVCTSTHHHVCHTSRSVQAPTFMQSCCNVGPLCSVVQAQGLWPTGHLAGN